MTVRRLPDGGTPLWVAGVLGALVVASCGGDPAAPPEPPRPASVSVSPEAAALDYLGATAAFTATITDQYGAAYAGAVAWSSSDAGVAGVDSDGLVTAVGNGTATVAASFQGLSDSASVTVQQLPASVEAVSGEGQVVPPGRPLPEPVVVRVADGGGSPIEGVAVAFAGDGAADPSSAVTDTAGVARTTWTLGETEGAQTLTAAVADGPSAQITATAEPPRPVGISVSPEAVALDYLGATAAFVATITDQYGEAYASAVAWSSSDAGVAGVDSDGLVTAVGNGTATVAASFQGLSDSASVSVQQLPASVEVVSGQGQVVPPGRLLPEPVVVRVADGGGSPVEGVAVAFAGDGTVDPSSAVTDTAGVARTAWTLGETEGAQTLTATVADGPSAQITATAERLPVVSWATVASAAPEGGIVELAVEASPPPRSPISVTYSLAPDADAATPDADTADYVGGPTGVVEIARGRAGGVVRLAVVDDDQIEPPREVAVVTLQVPEEADGYQLGARVEATATILEGVCDRTPGVRDELARVAGTSGECASVTAEGLAALGELRLRGPDAGGGQASLSSLRVGDFAGLSGVRLLDLGANQITALPEGVLAGLAVLEDVDLSNNRIAELPATLFAGLPTLRRIDLSDNALAGVPQGLLADADELEELRLGGNLIEALPAGFFEGMAHLTEVRLDNNPGAPFPIPLTLERTDTTDLLAPGPATLAVSVAGGAPFDLVVVATVRNGSPATASFAVAAGSSRSAEVAVTQAAGSGEPTLVESSDAPAIPDRYTGLEVRLGPSLVLFAKPRNDAPIPHGTVPDHVLQAGGPPARWDVRPYFTDDDPVLAYSVSASDERLVRAEVDGREVVLTGLRPGETRVRVTATDPSGRRASHSFATTVLRAPNETAYEIDMIVSGGFSDAHVQVLERAARRWQGIVTRDVPAVQLPDTAISCFGDRRQYALNVDDLLIYVSAVEIDGVHNVVARAGPCLVRSESYLPLIGSIDFDVSDLSALGDGFFSVALHEMGHVLGIGVLWDWFGHLQNPSLPNNEGADTHFDGPRAVAAFDGVGGSGYTGAKVPVENSIGEGSNDAHWRYAVFGSELMNPYFLLDRPTPLSAVTVQSLADMGYSVDPRQADFYRLPGVADAAEEGAGHPEDHVVELHNDVRKGPIVVMGQGGRVLRVIRR